MHKTASFFRTYSEKYHFQLHVIFGAICGMVVSIYFPDYSARKLVLLGIIGNLVPDIDHLFYIFWYGAQTEYSKFIKTFIKDKKLRNAFLFIRTNHKEVTGLYSHNFVSLILVMLLFWFLGDKRDSAAYSVFFLSWFVHYIFDIFEDLLFFKKVNPNWFLKFNKKIPALSDDFAADRHRKKK